MPKIQLLSDLHFEFHRDGGRAFVSSLNPQGVDVLVLAGDTGTQKGGSLRQGLRFLVQRYGETPIVMVAGNHEFYGGTREDITRHMEVIQKEFPTVHWLENSTVTLAGQRFIGGTLWFPDTPDSYRYEGWLNDFRVIRGFKDWVYDVCSDSMRYLSENIQEGDFVVTHHIPDAQGIHPKYRKGPSAGMNRFFLCQMPQEVLGRGDWWAFGHTHDSMAFQIGNCRFRCNPLSYPQEGNPHFSKRLVLAGRETITCPVCGEPSEWGSDHFWTYGPKGECPYCSSELGQLIHNEI